MSNTITRALGAVAIAGTMAGAAFAGTAVAHAETFNICPSRVSGVATADTSCAFADSVYIAWYSQPGTIINAYSPVTGLSYTMQCSQTTTDYWYEAKRCVGVNGYGVGLIVYVD